MRNFSNIALIAILLAGSNFAFAQTDEIDQVAALTPDELVQFCTEQAKEQGLEAEEAKAFIAGCSTESNEGDVEEVVEEETEQSVETEETPEKP